MLRFRGKCEKDRFGDNTDRVILIFPRNQSRWNKRFDFSAPASPQKQQAAVAQTAVLAVNACISITLCNRSDSTKRVPVVPGSTSISILRLPEQNSPA
jgi:hypothetical protein